MSRATTLAATTLGVLLAGCGGGGGSGPGGGPGPVTDDTVALVGFGFRSGTGELLSAPPFELLDVTPPQLGAPLNLTVIFEFDGVPEGPFDATTLPVFTTPEEVTPLVTPLGDAQIIPAKGSYVLVGQTVEFRPFVPSAPLQVDLFAPPAAVPGLLPGSVYTARVNAGLTQLGNLGGAGGEVQFGTTSNATAFYPTEPGQDDPPALVTSTPADGSVDFFPGVFSATPPGAAAPSFPAGDDSFVLTFDRALAPTTDNLQGSDLDGDGLVDPAFFLRTRGTRLMLAHETPAGAFGGGHGPFAALSAYEPGATPDPGGADVVLHAGDALPDPEAGLSATPSALAAGREPGLLWAVLPVDDGPDLLTVVDHVLGDPTHARLAEVGSGLAGAPSALDTGLDDIGALTATLDGRLLAYDRSTRRIHELRPSLVRRLPEPGATTLLPPQLLDLVTGDGVDGFLGAPLSDPGAPADPELLDLATSPDGELLALVRPAGADLPRLVRMHPVDPDLDGEFGPLDGTLGDDPQDVLLELTSDVIDVEVERAGTLLALDRGADALLRIDLADGATQTVVADVAGFGTLALGEPSPARAFSVGFVELDVQTTLLANTEAGAVVRLRPSAVLPPGRDVDVMQRQVLSSLYGTSLAGADPDAPRPPLGATRLLGVTTSEPLAGPGAPVDDAFLERFDDQLNENPAPTTTNPPAEWALPGPGGVASGGLRASVGVSKTATLGDFLPQPSGNFQLQLAWQRTKNPPEPDLRVSFKTSYNVVLLDTDAQTFPLTDGSTPGVNETITVLGGRFAFRDIVIPESVRVVARGTRPLVLTATGRVEIHGLIDLKGTDGFSDDTFDSGFLPVPGGPGGPAAGRGGDGQPSRFDPSGPGTLDQYVTPERGERGMGPVPGPSGEIDFAPVGGLGGLSTLGYQKDGNGYPRLQNTMASVHHRPPGGGGGSYYARGATSYEGAGVFLVQSDSTWFPYTKCQFDDQVRDALYGNDENFFCGGTPITPLQCVYMVGTPDDPERLKPGAGPGEPLFPDGDRANDYIGPGGELELLLGGQGGGGGGSRVDSMVHKIWSSDVFGTPTLPPLGPPCYPKLYGGIPFAPSMFDAKGAGGGGGGGSIQIRSFGEIVLGPTGHIDVSGGHGGGAEVVRNSNFAGGGGGGSGGAILLQASGAIRLEADPGHLSAGYLDADGDHGASLDVSGGFGRDGRTDPSAGVSLQIFTWDVTRGDGGQGGFGIAQLQAGTDGGQSDVQQGAYVFARQRTQAKLGPWTGDNNAQDEHPSFGGNSPPTKELRYYEMMHWRPHSAEGPDALRDRDYVLNGSWPPSLPSNTGLNGMGSFHEYPPGSGQLWADTKMLEHPPGSGAWYVEDPQPERVFKTYNGQDYTYNGSGVLTKVEDINFPADHPDFPGLPGETYKDELVPLALEVQRPSGLPPMIEVDGVEQFDPDNLVDRLPMVPFGLAPPPFGAVSHGTSRWLDFSGVTLRTRADSGLTPPFFGGFHGTHNASVGAVPADKSGQVVTDAVVPGKPARFVQDAGPAPFDPGLFGNGAPPDPAYNDVVVHSPDIDEQHAVTDNATVAVRFQGARPVRTGSRVPDPDTLTEWLADPTALDGYPLVRFRVVFDVGADPQAFPFDPDSFRPFVDELRLRARY